MMSTPMAGDPMATDCVMKAQAAADPMAMAAMVGECHVMYPEDMATTCLSTAMVETDAMKQDAMVDDCHAMYPMTAPAM